MLDLFPNFHRSSSLPTSHVLQSKSTNSSPRITPKMSRKNRSSSLHQDDNQSPLLSLSNFTPIRVLGQGAFGKVMLVRDNENNKLFAMKVIKKKRLRKNVHITRIKAERALLASTNSPFVPKLYSAFQTNEKLYLIMDYCPGGELYFHLTRYQKFSEPIVRFIIAEIILALEAIHVQGYVYRDLKPENILLDEKGHIKLCDLGLVRSGIMSFTEGASSVSGTPEYMSPEMISKEGYGFCTDFWALGMLTYELLNGSLPWYSNDRQEFFHRIITDPLSFPNKISNTTKSFISGLLTKNPRSRLGVNGFHELKNNLFFLRIDWEALSKKEVESPFNPCHNLNVESLHDDDIQTDNFDTRFTRLPVVSQDDPEDSGYFSGGFAFMNVFSSGNDQFQGFEYLYSDPQSQRSISISEISTDGFW